VLVSQPPFTHQPPKRKEKLIFNPYTTYYTSLINLVNKKRGMMTLTPFPQNQVGRRGSLYKYLIGIFSEFFNYYKQKGSNGITKTPLYMGGRRGFTPHKHTNQKAINYL
jgi:hypothetical protein